MASTLALPAVLFAVLIAVKLSGLGVYVYSEHFYVYFYIFVCFWGKNEIHMQICSVANQRFKVFNSSTIFFIISMALPIAVPAVRDHLTTYLYACLAIQAVLMF
jgi:hypothetical protein